MASQPARSRSRSRDDSDADPPRRDPEREQLEHDLDDLERWKETFRVRWRTSEHNNIGELRTVILALRHASRSSRAWDSRILMITDSLVSLGVLAKGRTSSWPLLRLARQGAALTMAFGFRVYYRYVESKRNHADGPSRGFPLGVAPAWVGAQERRKEIQRALQRRSTASR